MPEIEGQVFPQYEHTIYPKVVYKGGASHGDEGVVNESRIVQNGEEEAEAAEDGFLPVAPDPEVEDEVAADPVETDGSEADAPDVDADADDDGDGEADAEVEAEAVAEEVAEAEAPEQPAKAAAPADADGDGHDDKTGQFVAHNTGRRGRR